MEFATRLLGARPSDGKLFEFGYPAMLIRNLTISKVGPFYAPTVIDIHPRVTVITGANDVGKSFVLRSLELAFNSAVIDEREVNHDHLHAVQAWQKDGIIRIDAVVELHTEADAPQATKGDMVTVHRQIAPQVNKTTFSSQRRRIGPGNQSFNFPKIIRPKLGSELKNEIDLRTLAPLEQALMDAAFETAFSFERLEGLSDLQYSRAIRRAETKLNELLAEVVPSRGSIHFDLLPLAGDKARVGLLVRDQHDGVTPFGNRGDGLRKIVTLLAELITSHRKSHHRLILLDEPENSLHADAQHLLREFLWRLTESGNTQVVYATHSPAMINPARPEQVRTLVRRTVDNVARSEVLERSAFSNFFGVRASLGISAADSLLYAPVTIVTEGETEVRCLKRVLDKLVAEANSEFSDVPKLLGLSHVLDGMGDSFELIARFAHSHGTKVIIFLDGDKRQRVAQQGADKLPNIPVVFLPGTTEFEEIIPPEAYLKSLMALAAIEYTEGHLADLEKWTEASERRKKMAFSKRVEMWFRESFDQMFPAKPAIMLAAIDSVQVAHISSAPFAELVKAMRDALAGTSFD